MLKAHMQLAFNDEVPPLYRRVSNGGHDDYDIRDDTDAEQTTAARHHRSADSSPVSKALYTHSRAHAFNCPLSGTTRVSQC